MKPSNKQVSREKFITEELLRFYEGSKKHGKKYLEDTLNIWRANSGSGPYQRSYKEAVRRIGESNVSGSDGASTLTRGR
jgi:hypothetical protein